MGATIQVYRDNLARMRGELAKAVPKHVDPERLERMAITVLQTNSYLREKCDLRSVLGAIMQAAQLGLYPDNTILGHSYLVPYKGKCQLIPGYKGLIDLARRGGHVTSIAAYPVREGDFFEFEYGLNPVLVHRPEFPETIDPERPIKDLSAVYAIARLRGEPVPQFMVMFRHEVERIRKGSPAADKGPWVTYYEPMALKTVIRRLVKYLPLSSDIQMAVGLDEAYEAGIDQGLKYEADDVVEGELLDDETPSELDGLANEHGEPSDLDKALIRGSEMLGDDWRSVLSEIKQRLKIAASGKVAKSKEAALIEAIDQAIAERR